MPKQKNELAKHAVRKPSIIEAFTKTAFKAIDNVKTVLETRRCKNQYVGLIGELSSEAADFKKRLPVNKRPNGLNCVILVLESPHIEEFPHNDKPRPANGKTGRRIRDQLKNVLQNKRYSSYGLILMNSIQYQCSLGFPTKYFRDEVFFSCWASFGKRKFAARLKQIYRPGDIVLNCCTKGKKKKKEIRKVVDSVIKKYVDESCILRRFHPVSWFSKKHINSSWQP